MQIEIIDEINGGEIVVHRNPRTHSLERFVLQDRHVVRVENVILDTQTGIIFDENGKIICESSNYSRDYLLATAFPKPFKHLINEVQESRTFLLPSNGYWHWIMEDLPNFLRVKNLMTTKDSVSIYRGSKNYIYDYLKTMKLNYQVCPRYQSSANHFTTTYMTGSGWADPRDIFLLRQEFRDFMTPSPRGDKIYASRRFSSRSPSFEIEIERAFVDHGWKIVYNEELTLTQQIELYSNASYVCGIGGSNLTNIVWAPQHVTLIEISPKWFSPCFSRLSETLAINYSLLDYEILRMTSSDIISNVLDLTGSTK